MKLVPILMAAALVTTATIPASAQSSSTTGTAGTNGGPFGTMGGGTMGGGTMGGGSAGITGGPGMGTTGAGAGTGTTGSAGMGSPSTGVMSGTGRIGSPTTLGGTGMLSPSPSPTPSAPNTMLNPSNPLGNNGGFGTTFGPVPQPNSPLQQ